MADVANDNNPLSLGEKLDQLIEAKRTQRNVTAIVSFINKLVQFEYEYAPKSLICSLDNAQWTLTLNSKYESGVDYGLMKR